LLGFLLVIFCAYYAIQEPVLFWPPISLERILQVLFGEDKKSRSSDCFSVLATLSLDRFDYALHVI
jgi:hypothetical protein